MKQIMKKDALMTRGDQQSLGAQFQLLRTRVESSVSGPAVIVITSAEAGDGASLTAVSLAECLARSGRRTAFLKLDDADNAPLAAPLPTPTEDRVRSGLPMPISIPDAQLCLTRDDVRSYLDSVRASFDFLIVDAPELVQSQRAMALSELADGVLLSVRVGRCATENDHITRQILEESKANIIGVVAAKSDAIGKFERSTQRQTKALTSSSRESEKDVTTVKRPLVSRIVGASFGLIILFASVVAFATLQPEKYKSLAVIPEPAKAVVTEIVSKLRHSPK